MNPDVSTGIKILKRIKEIVQNIQMVIPMYVPLFITLKVDILYCEEIRDKLLVDKKDHFTFPNKIGDDDFQLISNREHCLYLCPSYQGNNLSLYGIWEVNGKKHILDYQEELEL